jgi:heme/copper-type cytochrome/quinol oxidase subunit 2
MRNHALSLTVSSSCSLCSVNLLSAQLQAKHQKPLLQEQEEEQYLGVAKMALAPVLLVMAGAIFAYFVCRSRQEEPKNPETEKLVGDTQCEENVGVTCLIRCILHPHGPGLSCNASYTHTAPRHGHTPRVSRTGGELLLLS